MKWRTTNDICKMTLLYVDDDADVTKMVIKFLSKNYPTQEIIHAENGFEAIYKIEEYDPDILLVDLFMPFLDGIRFVEHILKKSAEHQVIFLSVCNDPQMIRRCLATGAKYYIAKPINFDSLFYKIDTLMLEIFYKRLHQAKRPRSGVGSVSIAHRSST